MVNRVVFFSLLTFFLVSRGFADLNVAIKQPTIQKHKKFVLVVNAFNAEDCIEQNLDSITIQNYENYHVICIDDASTDNTSQTILDYISQTDLEGRITFIQNIVHKGPMHGFYHAVQMCDDQDIVVLLDAASTFLHDRVLTDINRYYANEEVWAAIIKANFISDNSSASLFRPLEKKYLEQSNLRKESWCYAHLKTFYAYLFKNICLEEITYRGEFVSSCTDMAICIPIAEMAREHLYFIPEEMCSNFDHGFHGEIAKTGGFQTEIERYIRDQKPHQKVQNIGFVPNLNDKADVVLFSEDRPMELYAGLEALSLQEKHIGNVFVLYRNSVDFERGYQVVEKSFPNVFFYKIAPFEENLYEFSTLLKSLVKSNEIKKGNYLLIGSDSEILTQSADLGKALKVMNFTGAFSYYFAYGPEEMDKTVTALDDICLWDFHFHSNSSLKNIFCTQYGLFKRSDIANLVDDLSVSDLEELDYFFARKAPMNRIGLVSSISSVKILKHEFEPLAENMFLGKMTSYELSRLLVAGFKIDLSRLGEEKVLSRVYLTSRLEEPPFLASAL